MKINIKNKLRKFKFFKNGTTKELKNYTFITFDAVITHYY